MSKLLLGSLSAAALPAFLRVRAARLRIGMHSVELQGAGSGPASVDLPGGARREDSLSEACVAVRGLLASHPRMRMTAQLASAWCRILVLPWVAHLTREERWKNYARARFDQVFGANSEEWDLQVGRDAPGCDRIAVAWPERLRSELATYRNIRSVRVDLLEHLGVLLGHEPRFTGCVLELEESGASMVLLRDGKVRRARWCRFDGSDGLISAIRSEWAAIGATDADAKEPGLSLALAPPAPIAGTDRAQIVAALTAGLGFRRAFSLPELH